MNDRLLYDPEYQSLAPFLESLPERFEHEGETIFQRRNTLKRYTLPEGVFVVKRYKVPHLLNRIAYTFFRPSKAQRAYRYARRLIEKGFRTPQPIAYLERFDGPLFRQGYFVYREESYTRLLREFHHGGPAGRETILDDLAAYTLRLHENGILHIDYSPGNILFETDPDGHARFSLIDLNRMRFGPPSRKACLHNLVRITPDPETFDCLLRAYLRLRGWNSEADHREATRAFRRFWAKRQRKDRFRKQLRKLKQES